MKYSVKSLRRPIIDIVTRDQWGARPPKTPPEKLKIPVEVLQVFDTRTKDCFDLEACKKQVLDLQNEYMFYRGFDDIPWNFLIGGDGRVYEGRGFYVKSIKTDLEHPRQKAWEGRSVDVAYIGDYRKKYAKLKVSTALGDLTCESDRLGVMETAFTLHMFIKKPKDWRKRLIIKEYDEPYASD